MVPPRERTCWACGAKWRGEYIDHVKSKVHIEALAKPKPKVKDKRR